MYPGEIVLIENTKYVLGAYLSSGLITTVFPAWNKAKGIADGVIPSNEKNGEPDLAIKVLAPNADQTLRTRFLSEYNVLRSANEKWHKLYRAELSPFPAVQQASWQEQEVLALEFVPQAWDFGKVVGEQKTSLERERFCLHQAVRYAQMLQILHQARYVCLDRKPIDVYFDTLHERLIVLDWNVVESFTEQKVADEHAIFAAIWYGFLTGKVPPADLNPLDDELWDAVSLATRSLLNDLWLGRYKDDVELIENLIKTEENLNKLPSLLLDQAPTIEQIKENEKHAKPCGELYWEGLALRDLAYRVADKGEQAELKRQLEDFQKFFEDRFGRLFFDAQMSLRKEMYNDGLAYLHKIRESVQGDATLELQHERWRVLLDAGKIASEQGLSFFDISGVFQNWLKVIQERSPRLGHVWRQMFVEIVKVEKFQELIPIRQSLSTFETEIQIREKWDDVEQKFKDSKGSQISDHHYRNIQGNLNDIGDLLKGLPDTYAKALRQVLFPDFDIQKRRVDERVDAEVAFYNIEQVIEKTFLEAPLQYLQYRLQDLYLPDQKQLESFRLTLGFLQMLADLVENNRSFSDKLLSDRLQYLISQNANVTNTLTQKMKYLIEKDSSFHEALLEQTKKFMSEAVEKKLSPSEQVLQRFVEQVSMGAGESLHAWTDDKLRAELLDALNTFTKEGVPNTSLNNLQLSVKKIRESLDLLQDSSNRLSSTLDKKSKKEWQAYLDYWISELAKLSSGQSSQGN